MRRTRSFMLPLALVLPAASDVHRLKTAGLDCPNPVSIGKACLAADDMRPGTNAAGGKAPVRRFRTCTRGPLCPGARDSRIWVARRSIRSGLSVPFRKRSSGRRSAIPHFAVPSDRCTGRSRHSRPRACRHAASSGELRIRSPQQTLATPKFVLQNDPQRVEYWHPLFSELFCLLGQFGQIRFGSLQQLSVLDYTMVL
jgi:hypothetical protein